MRDSLNTGDHQSLQEHYRNRDYYAYAYLRTKEAWLTILTSQYHLHQDLFTETDP